MHLHFPAGFIISTNSNMLLTDSNMHMHICNFTNSKHHSVSNLENWQQRPLKCAGRGVLRQCGSRKAEQRSPVTSCTSWIMNTSQNTLSGLRLHCHRLFWSISTVFVANCKCSHNNSMWNLCNTGPDVDSMSSHGIPSHKNSCSCLLHMYDYAVLHSFAKI